jgi:hypothetical protein
MHFYTNTLLRDVDVVQINNIARKRWQEEFISILQHFPFTFVITVLYTDTDHNKAFLILFFTGINTMATRGTQTP